MIFLFLFALMVVLVSLWGIGWALETDADDPGVFVIYMLSFSALLVSLPFVLVAIVALLTGDWGQLSDTIFD